MNKKIRNIILIFFAYILSFFIFAIPPVILNYFGYYNNNKDINLFNIILTFSTLGYGHFLFCLIIAIRLSFCKKVDDTYKAVTYIFALLSFFGSPLAFPCLLWILEDYRIFLPR